MKVSYDRIFLYAVAILAIGALFVALKARMDLAGAITDKAISTASGIPK